MNDLATGFHLAAAGRTPFAHPAVRRYAQELAQDHAARGGRLVPVSRGGSASGGDWGGALEEFVRSCGWRGPFDAFAGDPEVLLASHVVQAACAGVFQLGARRGPELAQVAGEAAYHAALVRTALAGTASARAVVPVAEAVDRRFAELRRGAGDDDPVRHALSTLFLTSRPATRGGFLPQGLGAGRAGA